MSGRAMRQRGFVVSDLHLFTQRSHARSLQPHLDEAMRWADWVVLNGDIVDFKWTVLPTVDGTIRATLDWLERLACISPGTRLHYVLGNHDALEAWAEALEDMAGRVADFHWHPTHLRIGSAFFTHGDLQPASVPGGSLARRLHRRIPRQQQVLHDSYDTLFALRLHHVVRVTHGRRQSVRRMLRVLRSLDPGLLEGVQDVYFGHTHVPFSGHEEGGFVFHNTGSAIRGLPFHPQVVLPT